MRHKWDYGKLDGRNARHRQCTACQAEGRRFGYGSAPWDTKMPDGSRSDGRVPPCPGTPWTRREDGWEMPRDYLTPKVITYLVTFAEIREHGREKTQRRLAKDGKPPLPEAAWEDAA